MLMNGKIAMKITKKIQISKKITNIYNFFGLNKKHNRQNYLSERNFWNEPLFGGFLC